MEVRTLTCAGGRGQGSDVGHTHKGFTVLVLMLTSSRVVWPCLPCPRRQYSRLRTLLKDPRHDCVLFANEFQEYAYRERERGESQEKWQTR